MSIDNRLKKYLILCCINFSLLIFFVFSGFKFSNVSTDLIKKEVNLQRLTTKTGQLVRVNNMDLINDFGEKITLRGVVFSNCAVYSLHPDDLFQLYKITQKDYVKIAELGANSVRFNIQYYWLETKEKREVFFRYLDQQIKYAKNTGVYLILNLHYFGRTDESAKGLEDGFYSGDKYDKGYDLVSFWYNISRRYRYEPQIIGYDLINEPRCNNDFSEIKLYQQYTQIIQMLRANDDDHIVFIAEPDGKILNPQNYPIKEPFKKLEDNNVAYTYHWYHPILFTHQSMFEWAELGAMYPFVEYQVKYFGGYYANPDWTSTKENNWQLFSGNWVNIFNDSKADFFNIALSAGGVNDRVWFDDIVLEKRSIDGSDIEQLKVANASFDDPRRVIGWSKNPQYSSSPANWYEKFDENGTVGVDFTWDRRQDHTGNNGGALLVDGRNVKWAVKNWAIWSQDGGMLPLYYKAEPGYEYRVKAWIKSYNKVPYKVSITFNYFKGTQQIIDKEWIHKKITNYYHNWSHKYKVPIYCGEFGLTNPAQLGLFVGLYPESQKMWLKDVVNILNKLGHSWSFHDYKDYNNRIDMFGIFEDGYENLEIQRVLREGF